MGDKSEFGGTSFYQSQHTVLDKSETFVSKSHKRNSSLQLKKAMTEAFTEEDPFDRQQEQEQHANKGLEPKVRSFSEKQLLQTRTLLDKGGRSSQDSILW